MPQGLDGRAATPAPLTKLSGFAKVAVAFGSPITVPPDLPPKIAGLATRVAVWAERSAGIWRDFDSKTTRQKVAGIGVAIGDAIRLQHQIRTKPIDDWLTTVSADARATFENWRRAFFERCDALGCLGAEGLIAGNLMMPEDGFLKMAAGNSARLGKLLGARNGIIGSVGVLAGMAQVVVRERRFFAGLIGRQAHLSAGSFSKALQARRARRLNAMSGMHLISPRHAAELRAAYAELEQRGVTGQRADTVVLQALKYGHDGSGKSWKGLTRLVDLIFYSDVDPNAADFEATFRAVMHAPVDYTHVPGREWIVRDYELGSTLMQIDGRIATGDTIAALQQGRGSLAVGYLRAGAARTEFGRRYSKPLGAFLDSMVAADGADHQRQRKAFLPFFTQRAILEHAAFVEETTETLLDDVERLASANHGAFDFRTDFAYRFPIQIICRVLELPPDDVPRVQRWSEESVRAMDTDAGVTPEIAKRGQRATDEFRVYLQTKLNEARAGRFNGTIIKAIAGDQTLSEAERIGNLGVIIFAGFETTTGLLSKGLYALLQHRDQWAFLAESIVHGPEVEVRSDRIPDSDLRWLVWSESEPQRNVDQVRHNRLTSLVDESPDLKTRLAAVRTLEHRLDAAVEEMLRWSARGTVVPLTASKDVTVPLPSAMTIKSERLQAGDMLEFKCGETIAVAVDELNRRCPFGAGRFDPDARGGFDVSRTDNTSHLSFGLKHSCMRTCVTGP